MKSPDIATFAALQHLYPTGRRNLNLNFAISLMANTLSFNSANYKIVQNFSMIIYIIKIKKSNFANI